MPVNQLFECLKQWQQHGWIRALDKVFAEFLYNQGEQSPWVLFSAFVCSHQVGRGYTEVSVKDLLEQPNALLNLPPEYQPHDGLLTPADIVAQLNPAELERALTASVNVSHNGTSAAPLVFYLNRHDQSGIALYRFWRYEAIISDSLQQRMAVVPSVDESLLKQTLETLFGAEKALNWQRLACANSVLHNFSVITGGPGTGKTHTVVRLLAALQRQALEHADQPLRVALAAPTGKAAARLRESIIKARGELTQQVTDSAIQRALEQVPSDSQTLHRLLAVNPQSRRPNYHSENPLRYDVIVVDEASMVDSEMMQALLQATAISARVILLGDKDQLASVEAGAVLGNLCEQAEDGHYQPEHAARLAAVADSTAIPLAYQDNHGPQRLQHVAMLRKSYRSEKDILALAKAVNQGDLANWRSLVGSAEKATADAQVQTLIVKTLQDHAFQQFVKQGFSPFWTALNQMDGATDTDAAVKEVLERFSDFQLLTALRKGEWGVAAVNQRITEIIGASRQSWYHGRPIMVTQNDYGLKLSNGDIGIAIRDHKSGRLRVAFASIDKHIKWVLPSRLVHVETAYAMTVHKSQGSEFAHAALILPDYPSPVLNRELIYTGITRAKQRVSLVGRNLRIVEPLLQSRNR
ncbi:exodeoxyribonuclease V subunit alpha [Idiomarina tyrosinivorans]|uniref:RecBCD enzyme subunit RecD n=1 Tax=Idiomarina tyrosinivorans TaxID=1445662 RepID=A0A432ZT87_9GAMM|nr:exodeoxyribonuclease V subunit alpha [Idiomarina tyrosinivorans]RUO81093.1 exodeoxyribonuclease V subunit alpha [Idiomarina tyrosinivorans]